MLIFMTKQSSFSFETPEQSPGFLLWRMMTAWQRLIKKALEPYELSHAQFVIMAASKWFAEHEEEATQVNIVVQTGLDKMTVSKSLKKLVAQKLMLRVENEKDTRAKLVSLTRRGNKLIEKLVPVVEGIDREFFGVLKQNEQQSLIKQFIKLIPQDDKIL